MDAAVWRKWEALVRPFYKDFPPSHNFSHIERVYKLAARIGKEEGADLYILGLAVLLHDLGRPEEEESNGELCHAEVSAEKARRFLTESSVPAKITESIVHCIDTHRFRGEKKPLSLEAKCLYDADKLECLGAVGVARSYLWLGEHGGSVYSDPAGWDLLDPDLDKPECDSLQREWFIKYRFIKEKLFTVTASRIAEKREKTMENFLHVLQREVNGEE